MALPHPVWILLGFAPLSAFCLPPIWTQPEQVHLSYPGGYLGSSLVLGIFFLFDLKLVKLFRSKSAGSSKEMLKFYRSKIIELK